MRLTVGWRRVWVGLGCGVALLCLGGQSAADVVPAAAKMSADETMQSVSQEMFKALDQNRELFKKKPEAVYPLVEKILIPHFDLPYASKLVLSRQWSQTTEDQHNRFTQSLKHALTRLYGAAITDFSADRLKFLPSKNDPAATEAVVRSVVTRASGTTVPVDYRLHLVNQQWLVYDVVIEGVSYVRNYRTDLGAEIEQKGIEEVIDRLGHEGAK
jgi:phospholipid transport system substrate-binding protein